VKRRHRNGREIAAPLLVAGACATVPSLTTPGGWERFEIEPGVEFAVPPDAQRAGGTAVDSVVGVFDGDGYRITYDLGRFGENLQSLLGEESYRSQPRDIGGRSAVKIAFRPSDEPFAWARIAQVDAGSGQTLTVRVSCQSVERCTLAEDLFDSIVLTR